MPSGSPPHEDTPHCPGRGGCRTFRGARPLATNTGEATAVANMIFGVCQFRRSCPHGGEVGEAPSPP
jgi:hypothetical protein